MFLQRFKSNQAKVVKVFKTSEFRAALYASVIAFAISPFAQLISYKLTEFWSRPLLSVEYISVNKISRIENLDAFEHYFQNSIVYDDYLGKNFSAGKISLKTIQQDTRAISPSAVAPLVLLEVQKFLVWLDNEDSRLQAELTKVNEMSLSELKMTALINSDDYRKDLSDSGLRKEVMAEFSNKLHTVRRTRSEVIKLKSEIRPSIANLQFRLSVLNNGSTDGLIRNEGMVFIRDTAYQIKRIAPPSSVETLNAVPTYNVDPATDFSSNSVGRIEKNTMSEFWFEVTSPGNYQLHCGDRIKIVLKDQNNRKISKKQVYKCQEK